MFPLGFQYTWSPPAENKCQTKNSVSGSRFNKEWSIKVQGIVGPLWKVDQNSGGWRQRLDWVGLWSKQLPLKCRWHVSQALGLPPSPFTELNISLCPDTLGKPQICLFSNLSPMSGRNEGEREGWRKREDQFCSHESMGPVTCLNTVPADS